MEIEIKREGDRVVALLSGELDGKSAPHTQATLLPLVEEGNLILALDGLSYMSSAGLRMLLLLHRQATARERRITLVGLSEEIKDTMSITGFLHFFALADSLERVLA